MGLDTYYENLRIQVNPRVVVKSRIVGNLEILGKFQIWVGTQPSAQSPFYKRMLVTLSG